jgi:hypothetical protein
MIVLEDLGNQYGYEKLAPTTSTGITKSVYNPTTGLYKGRMARAVLVGVETHSIRFREDGSAPTSSEGMLIAASNYHTIVNPENIKNFRCIDCSGASSVKILPYF